MAERLLACGMAGIIPESELAHHNGPQMVGGFFAVAKSARPSADRNAKRQRLIFDDAF